MCGSDTPPATAQHTKYTSGHTNNTLLQHRFLLCRPRYNRRVVIPPWHRIGKGERALSMSLRIIVLDILPVPGMMSSASASAHVPRLHSRIDIVYFGAVPATPASQLSARLRGGDVRPGRAVFSINMRWQQLGMRLTCAGLPSAKRVRES